MAADPIRGLVSELVAEDVHLYVDGSELKYRARKGAIREGDRRRIKENKAAIIEYLCKLQHVAIEQPVALPPIDRVERDSGGLPLSYGQLRLWFIDQFEGGSAHYNIQCTLWIEGKLDTAALEEALTELLDRHEILRTCYVDVGGEPRQVIQERRALPLTYRDLASVSDVHKEAQTRRWIQDDVAAPFDLRNDLVVRASIITFTQDAHLLVVTMHHIAGDGWSGEIFEREFRELYDAHRLNRPAHLSPLRIQYADYAVWQRGWLQGAVLEQQLSYWREQLQGLAPVHSLPLDKPRPTRQTFRGNTQRVGMPAALAERLRALSREQDVTLYMTLLSAFAVLLGRYAGQQDVAVGTPIANRTRREIEGLIGFFVNTLVMRHDLSGDPRFVDLLKRTREVALQAYAHQDIPFEQLVEKLNPQRSVNHSPLFQVMFILQNAPFEALAVPPLRANAGEKDLEDASEGTAHFDLTLSVRELPAGLVCVLEYNTDLFERHTIRRMLEHYARLLEAIVAAPQSRLSRLEMLGEQEKRQQLIEWNATARAYPDDKCIHELFEAQAEQTPDRIALVHEGSELTYAELNRRANRLAHQLIERGIRPEMRVGLCMQRSAQMVIGLLGILKAGGCYVPLDPKYPPARLRYLIEDSGVCLILSQHVVTQRLRAALSGGEEVDAVACVPFDEDWSEIERQPRKATWSAVCARNTAYVIYTSGSTGKPKGVAVEHASVLNLLASMERLVDACSTDAVAALTSLSFDIAGLELYLPLTTGARLILIPEDSARDGQVLRRTLEEHRVTLVQGTPATWSLLVDAGGLPEFTRGLCGGEAVPRTLADALARRSRVWNVYGPTETTIWSTACLLEEAHPVRIGRPISNTQVYVLDGHLEAVPIGVAGELYIGGAGLAVGYLNRPDLTAERFVPSRYALVPGERLYRTGDLARWLSDGSLEFLGRVDHQVKIRGFRIELGEIESVLLAHEAVRDAVVVARGDPGDKRLVSYVVAKPGAQADDAGMMHELRSYLQELLPGYMVPSAFVMLSSLPLTENRKVDRQALPAPDSSALALQEYMAPQGEIEVAFASIWQDLLHVERVGRLDNFFALGGHSLLALQVSWRIRQELRIELPIYIIFNEPTLAALAQHAERFRLTGPVAGQGAFEEGVIG